VCVCVWSCGEYDFPPEWWGCVRGCASPGVFLFITFRVPSQAGFVKYDSRTPEVQGLSVAFLVLITVCCGSALACSLIATLLHSTCSSFKAPAAREAYVHSTRHLWRAVPALFLCALAAMVVSLGLAGWGADFEAQALLLAWMGVVGAVATVGGYVVGSCCFCFVVYVGGRGGACVVWCVSGVV